MDNIITTEHIDAYCLSLLVDERAACPAPAGSQ